MILVCAFFYGKANLFTYLPLLVGDAAVVVFGVGVETSLSQLFLSSPMVLNPVVLWLPSPCFVPSHLNTIIKGLSTNEKFLWETCTYLNWMPMKLILSPHLLSGTSDGGRLCSSSYVKQHLGLPAHLLVMYGRLNIIFDTTHVLFKCPTS